MKNVAKIGILHVHVHLILNKTYSDCNLIQQEFRY